MAIFRDQFLSVIEWNEARDDVIFWKWANKEIKKNSRLIIRPGQDAIFIQNGMVEGIFTEEGDYDIETQIMPVLSTLKGFKFGFNSGLRAEVLFVNTKEFTESWGTKTPINIPSSALPGGLPVRAFGTFNIKVSDYMTLIEKVAGVKDTYAVGDVKERIGAVLNQYLMKWVSKEGKDLFNLQANSFEIGEGLRQDLDLVLQAIGFNVTGFNISSFNYPDEVQDRVNKMASVGMVGDLDRYQRVAVADAVGMGGDSSAGAAMQSAVGLAAGLNMASAMFAAGQPIAPLQTPVPPQTPVQASTQAPMQTFASGNILCAACGNSMGASAKFCPECGAKNEPKREKFCTNCGAKRTEGAKFCPECGARTE
jgi:membrane protease subunit (stomatin/prohibitin family)